MDGSMVGLVGGIAGAVVGIMGGIVGTYFSMLVRSPANDQEIRDGCCNFFRRGSDYTR